jgi:predicted DNA-binding protein
MTKVFSLQIPDQLYESLGRISKNENRSKGYVVRDLIEAYIENYADLQYAKQVSREIEEGRAELVSWENIKKKYKL